MVLETLLPQLESQSNIEDAVKQKMIKSRRQVEEIAATAYSSNDFDFLLCKRMPLTRLVVVVYLLTQKYAEYKAIGVTDEIILDTFSDVSLRANLYYKQHGKIGISKDDVVWFRHIMNVHIFKIGVLQYQTFNMVYLDEETIGEPYMVFTQEQKRTLPNGSPVINCHIQKGANISDSFDTDLFSGHSGKRHNSKKPAYRDSNGFPVRPDERTPGTPGGSKAGFTAFERPEDGGT